MYSDYEVECMYLGKPFEVMVIHAEDLRDRKTTLRSTDEPKQTSVHPLISLLVAAAR